MRFHSQNLKKEDGKKGLVHWRCWISFGDFRRETTLQFYFKIPSRFWHVGLGLSTGENAIELGISTFLGMFHFSIENHKLERWISQFTTRKKRGIIQVE